MFPELPRGFTLPITCEHRFSFGKRTADPEDIPDGWAMEWIPSDEGDEPEREGFQFAPTYIVGDPPRVSFTPEDDSEAASYLFLRNPDGKIVATWDEGRWWTQEESAAFRLFMQVPSTYVFAEGVRQASLPRRYRRRKK